MATTCGPTVPRHLEMSLQRFTSDQQKLRDQMAKNFGNASFAQNPMVMMEEQVRTNMAMFQEAMRAFAAFNPLASQHVEAPAPDEPKKPKNKLVSARQAVARSRPRGADWLPDRADAIGRDPRKSPWRYSTRQEVRRLAVLSCTHSATVSMPGGEQAAAASERRGGSSFSGKDFDEGAVDLQDADRQEPHVAERGVAGAKIVDRDARDRIP